MTSVSMAEDKYEYFKNLFGDEFRLKVYEEDKEIVTRKDYFTSTPEKGYKVAFTSQLPDLSDLSRYKGVLLLCDSTYTEKLNTIFSCNSSEILQGESDTLEYGFLSVDYGGTKYYIFPESVLVSSEDFDVLKDYFHAIHNADLSVMDDEELNKDGRISLDLSFASPLIRPLFYLALLYILVSVTRGLLNELISNPRGVLNRAFSAETPLKIARFFKCHRWISIFLFLFLTFMYIPLAVALMLKDAGSLNLSYFISYLLETNNPENLSLFISETNFFRAGVFFYNAIYFINIVILVLPEIIEYTIISFERVKDIKLSPKISKYTFPILLLLILSILMIEGKVLPTYFLVLLLLLSIYFGRQRFGEDITFNKLEKTVFMLTFILISTFGFGFNIYKKNIQSLRSYGDLINVKSKVVLLPYLKIMEETVLFNEYLIDSEYPVFVDNYLIYTPFHNTVKNTHINNFDGNTNFIVQSTTIDQQVASMIKYPEIEYSLESNLPTNLFNVSENLGEEATISIELLCSMAPRPSEIKIRYFSTINNADVMESSKDLMNYPGCLPDQYSSKYSIKIKPPVFIDARMYIYLEGLDSSAVSSISLGDTPLTFYRSNSEIGEILTENLAISSDSVINYFFDDTLRDTTFLMSRDSDGMYDLSKSVNTLVKEEKVGEEFLIWSTHQYLPIRDDLRD